MLILFLKMKNKNFFLSNELYSILKTQKLMNVKVFKVHIIKNNGFSKNFGRSEKKILVFCPKVGILNL